MITVEQALQLIDEHSPCSSAEWVPLVDSLNRVLAEDVASDIDSPPHDKSIVDGYAVQSADFGRAAMEQLGTDVELQVCEEITAGNVPTCEVTTGRAARIMTGAPIPVGADAVVMVEQTQWHDEPGVPLGVVRFGIREVVSAQNIMPRATSLRRGQVVLRCGTPIRPAEIGLLAEVGRSDVLTFSQPRVAVLPTGDELVDAGFTPGPGQIRNSNGPMLVACCHRVGAKAIDLGIGRDRRDLLRERVRHGLSADVLVISGGVSTGKLDLVPDVLADLGVRQVFHKIDLKPGKPLWFGVGPCSDDSDDNKSGTGIGTLVFGLPGNPVSSFVCFHLFVRHAIARLAGHGAAKESSEQETVVSPPRGIPPRLTARLARSFDMRGSRTTYHPAILQWSGMQPSIDPVPWHGSGDARALVDANALAIFPASRNHYEAGDLVECQLIDA